MQEKYIGITIGPILDTMLAADSPAGMWFVSFLFSDITKRLCERILEEKEFTDVIIYSPYHSQIENISRDGVGKYHDRVLFSAKAEENKLEEALRTIIYNVKCGTARYFCELSEISQNEVKQYLTQYLQIHYLIVDEIKQNVILDLSDRLSALELMKTFPENNSRNPILRLLSGNEQGKNELVKTSPLYTQIGDKSQLERNQKIRNIQMIAGADQEKSDFKRYNYFAVVNADGDRMGKTLEKLKNEQLKGFSQCLFRHAGEASKRIQEYGGMTIYAGGDDLLFLAPVIGRDGTTIFALCDSIQESFLQLMKEKNFENSPTLSFGIAIQYYKYPLYEAFGRSRELLAEAKKGEKNATAVDLQKHSGQSIRFKVSNKRLKTVNDFLNIQKNPVDAQEDRILWSILYTLGNYRALFMQLIGKEKEKENRKLQEREFADRWLNLFDNSGQKDFESYIRETAEFFYKECIEQEEDLLTVYHAENMDEAEKRFHALQILLRLKKFMYEKGSDEQ